jgi:hypothetical protein
VEDEKASKITVLIEGGEGLVDKCTIRTAQGFLAAK